MSLYDAHRTGPTRAIEFCNADTAPLFKSMMAHQQAVRSD